MEFLVRMSMPGSWTPGAEEHILRVADMETEEHGTGTLVEVLSEREQIQRGGVSLKMQCAIAFAKLVREHREIDRRAARQQVKQLKGAGDRTITDAQALAQEKRWIDTKPIVGSRTGEVLLVPGDLLSDDP